MLLPDGLTSRPLTLSDAAAVVEVMAAQQLRDIGEVVIEEADIVGDWQQPDTDLAANTVGVFDGDRLVAYGEVGSGYRGDASVHPDYEGRGIGTAIARWTQDRARERGGDMFGMPVPAGSVADRFLESQGYVVRWNSWVLALPEGAAIEEQPLPEGYLLRVAESDEDRRAAHEVLEDAFLEWSERERDPFENFEAKVLRRPGFEPWNVRVAVDPDGEVVGATVIFPFDGGGFVDKIGVRRDQRGKGLARAMLADAFAAARERGATRSELSTDSRTGALGLYEKVGMVVTSHWVNRAIAL